MTFNTNFRIKFTDKSIKDFGQTYPMLEALQERPIQVEAQYLKDIGSQVKDYLDQALSDLTTPAARSIEIEAFISASGETVITLPAPTRYSVLKTYLTLDDFYANLMVKASDTVTTESPIEEPKAPKKAKKATKKSTKKESPIEPPVVEAPAEAVVETPAEAVVEAPAEAVVEAPAEAVVEAPAEAVVEAPAKAVVEAPAKAVVEAPAKAVVEAPAKAVVEAPVEAVVEAPVVDSNPSQIKVVEHEDPFKNVTEAPEQTQLMAGSLNLGEPATQTSPTDLLQQALNASKGIENYDHPQAAPMGIPQVTAPQAPTVPYTPPTEQSNFNPYAEESPAMPTQQLPTFTQQQQPVAPEPTVTPESFVIETPAAPTMTFAQPNYTRTENNSALIDRIAGVLSNAPSDQLEQTKTYLIKTLMEALLQPAPGLILEPGEEHQRLVYDHASILGAFDYIIHG